MKNATKTEIEWLISLCQDPAKPLKVRLAALERLCELAAPLHDIAVLKSLPDPSGALASAISQLEALRSSRIKQVEPLQQSNREKAERTRLDTEALIGTLALHDKSVAQLVGIAQRALAREPKRWPHASSDPKYLRPLIQAAKNKN